MRPERATIGAVSGGVALRYITLAVGVLILLFVVGALLVDEGEVVRLTTFDAEGRASATGLWVVEVDGKTYLRAGSPSARWLARLRARPEVAIERDGVTRKARATVVAAPAVAAAVSAAMREKYGFIDAVIVRLIDHTRSVPVLIEPLEPARSGPSPPRGASP